MKKNQKEELESAYQSLLENPTANPNHESTTSETTPASKVDIQNLSNDIVNAIQNQKLGPNFDELAKKVILETYKEGRTKAFQQLDQKLNKQNEFMLGMQKRIDVINASRSEANIVATADHSKLSQLSEHFDKVVEVINHNTQIEQQLISVLRQPIKINGKELLKAIEQEQKQSISQTMSQNTARFILDAQSTTQHSVDENQRIKTAITNQTDATNQRFNKFEIRSFSVLTGLTAANIVPFWWLKLIVAMLIILGGFTYGEFR